MSNTGATTGFAQELIRTLRAIRALQIDRDIAITAAASNTGDGSGCADASQSQERTNSTTLQELHMSESNAVQVDKQMDRIVRSGDKITVPEGVKLKDAVDILNKQIAYEQQSVGVNEKIDGFFWDAAWAFYKAMCEEFGWVFQVPTPGFFGDKPPQLMAIESDIGETVSVPWGRFNLATLDGGHLETGFERDHNGRFIFKITGIILRKDEPRIKRLAHRTKEILVQQSLYKGKAVRIRFNDDDGDAINMPIPRFVDVRKAVPESLILAETVRQQVETSVFTPILHSQACRAARIPLKRGILLSGPYGTGKTLTAYVTAHLAEKNGWTFIYCERADELVQAVRFGMQYAPAVVFCEDIDREVHGERTVSMDDLLNVVDGIESKTSEIMVVLTSNHVDNINPALLRPGRLDAVIEFAPPDAKAATELVKFYGRGLVDPSADLDAVGEALKGQIPAVIRECVERAKLSQIKLSGGRGTMAITGGALLDAANGMAGQLKLLAPRVPPMTGERKLFEGVQEAVATAAEEGAAIALRKRLGE